jgi:hypothetical protein
MLTDILVVLITRTIRAVNTTETVVSIYEVEVATSEETAVFDRGYINFVRL